MSHPNPILQAIEERRTTNLFDPARGISDERIEELVRLATTAPTSFNLQNWRFVAVRTPEQKARLRALAWDQAKVSEAAVTFIVCGQLADHRTLPDRLAGAVEAGFMPAEMVPGWEGAAKSLYFEQPQRQRDEAVRSATFGAGMHDPCGAGDGARLRADDRLRRARGRRGLRAGSRRDPGAAACHRPCHAPELAAQAAQAAPAAPAAGAGAAAGLSGGAIGAEGD